MWMLLPVVNLFFETCERLYLQGFEETEARGCGFLAVFDFMFHH